MLTGELLAPPGLRRRERPFSTLRALGIGVPKRRWTWIPVPAFLIEHPSAGTVLVDTGLHSSTAEDPRRYLGRIGDRLYDVRMPDGGYSARDSVEANGLAAGDLAAIVMTHLHLDHACGLPELEGPPVIADAREWAAARAPTAIANGYARRHLAGPLDIRQVDFEGPDAGSYGPFARSVDLFGDGSVHLVSTPGHTRGHLSVLLRLRDREVLLAADAAYTEGTIAEGVMPGLWADETLFRRSLAEVQAFARRDGTLVIPGHDAEAWARLEEVYE